MPVRFLSDAQREQLSGFPAELEGEALDRFFTLSDADLAEVRRRHGDSNRLGWALQLCGLRMLGFCPDDMTTVPAVAVQFLARQLGVDPRVQPIRRPISRFDTLSAAARTSSARCTSRTPHVRDAARRSSSSRSPSRSTNAAIRIPQTTSL